MPDQTDQQVPPAAKPDLSKGSLLLAAALALPTINAAHAESAPERGIVAYKYLDYLDSQPGNDRIKVHASSVMVMAPVAGEWAVSGIYTVDSISGASPAYHTRQLTRMDDLRRAIDLRLTRYLPSGTLSVGTTYSHESDYISRGLSVQGTLATEDRNTTFNAGVGVSNDDINPSNQVVVGETKQVTDWILGLTQILTMQDIVQLNLGYSKGSGYFSDPYKVLDERPRGRDHSTMLARWNHYYPQTDGASRLSYRYYTDTYGIKAHTIAAEYAQPCSNGWTITPLARFYTQTAADFYLQPGPGSAPTFPAFDAQYYSLDQRLSEYGAVTLGFKIVKQLDPDWAVDFKFEKYEQRGSWAATGNGSQGLEPFHFRSFQFGLSRKF